jgi:hypothetical protein
LGDAWLDRSRKRLPAKRLDVAGGPPKPSLNPEDDLFSGLFG